MQRLSRDTYLPRGLSEDSDVRLAAVLLGAPHGAVISHFTAARLWELAVPLQPADSRVHLTVPTGSAVRNRADRCIHRTHSVAEEVTRVDGLLVTTLTRTWRDLAAIVSPPALLAVTDQVLRRCSVQELVQQLQRRPSGRGAARARAVLRVANPLAGSPMESVLRWLFQEAGLPTPRLQYVITDAGGGFIARVDFAWPEQKVVVEFDGDVHRDRDVFVRDLRRQNLMVGEGWRILRFTSADALGRSDEVIGEVRDALGA